MGSLARRTDGLKPVAQRFSASPDPSTKVPTNRPRSICARRVLADPRFVEPIMGGLSLGSVVFGKRSDDFSRPLPT